MSTSLPATEPLGSLTTLDRDHLHVFVIGPGRGEAIVIALPGQGWVVVDSCRIRGGPNPTLALLKVFRSAVDPIRAAILTHPHDDHSDGFADLVNGLVPDLVAVTGEDHPRSNLLSAVEAQVSKVAAGASTSQRRLAASVVLAAKAIRSWETLTGRQIVALHDGVSLALEGTGCGLQCRAPDAAGMRTLLGPPVDSQLAKKANHLSLVLELVFGSTVVVLGGDLPRWETGTKTPVATGWNLVLSRHPHLAEAVGLKVPHHGSNEALHPALLGPAANRASVATPYSSSDLPGLDDGEGAERLLASAPSLHLTSLPPSRDAADLLSHPARLSRKNLPKLPGVPDPILATARDVRGRREHAADGPVWCLRFDHAGRVSGRWRGASAVELV